MPAPDRIDFLVFYRKQLIQIIKKLDVQIKKEAGATEEGEVDEKEVTMDLKDPGFLRNYVTTPGLADAIGECRDFLNEISDEENRENDVLLYSGEKYGNRFAMIAISTKSLNLYFAPRLGLYDTLPPEIWRELKFGKSMGERWDKFRFTSPRQVTKGLDYLKGHLGAKEIKSGSDEIEGNSAVE